MRALLLVLLLYACYAAAAGDTAPARLVEGPKSIESLLRLPKDLQPGRYEIYCEAWVRRQGVSKSFTCYRNDDSPRTLLKAVGAAGRKAKFVPAMRDGVAVDVFMVVMVRIDVTAQGPLVLVVPNNGVERERFGPLYTAPQRFNEFMWDGHSGPYRGSRVLLWQKMRIDEHGKVLDCTVTKVADVPESFVRNIENQVRRMQFMPGYVDGKPTAMRYIEPVLD
jgi:hypothetical protein